MNQAELRTDRLLLPLMFSTSTPPCCCTWTRRQAGNGPGIYRPYVN
jgi:hypothetical protein